LSVKITFKAGMIISNKHHSKFVLLLILPVILFSQCTALKEISRNDIPQPKYTAFLVHTPDTSILLSYIEKSGEVLIGIIHSGNIKPTRNKTVDIFIAPDSAMIIKDTYIIIPVGNIAKLEARKVDGQRTILYTFLTFLIGIPLIGILSLAIGGGWGA